VAGRYRIETLIGMGGMGAVYRVSDTFETKQVALKVLSLVNNAMDAATAVERFRREARYAHQLRHKNIVPVSNFGQDGSLLFLEMPLITGGTLKELLKAERPLPTAQAMHYTRDLASAIDAIHKHPQEIIHRDIKPSNLLIHQDDGRLVLTDFGIARAMLQEKALTQRGWSLGTEHYIAPEQEQGKAQPASDIYAMGVVVYQMFTGLLPFQALIRNRGAELPAPSTLNKVLPPALDAVVLRAMEIDPGKRFPSASAFADALEDTLTKESFYAEPTVSESVMVTSDANVIVRTAMPENPCGQCGRENRSSSRFCRHCGQSLDATVPAPTDIGQVGYISDKGRHAANNEDMLLIVHGLCINLAPPPHPFGLFAVADGLRGPYNKNTGGHEASKLAIATVDDVLVPLLAGSPRPSPHNTPIDGVRTKTQKRPLRSLPRAVPSTEAVLEQWLRDATRQANRVIYHCNADYDATMASTLTIALQYEYRLYVASVGDSRAYHYNVQDKTLHLLNANSHAANLSTMDTIPPGKLVIHQHYLGNSYQVQIDVVQCAVTPGDLVLLCTDGLWHMIRDEQIKHILAQQGDAQQIVSKLINAANDAGGEGNISAILAYV
jgi:eukaryotic-like serine/threonine-protein kinase